MNDPTIKVQLCIGAAPLNGYLCVDPLASPDSGKIQHSLEDLSDIIDHNSCSEFLANDVLDYIPLQGKQQVLTSGWLTKVAHGGIFVITGVDIREAGRLIDNKSIDLLNQANQMLYGNMNHIWQLKKGLLSADNVVDMIMCTNQFKIESIKFNGPNYVITARRI